jgi:hypothetical protein
LADSSSLSPYLSKAKRTSVLRRALALANSSADILEVSPLSSLVAKVKTLFP